MKILPFVLPLALAIVGQSVFADSYWVFPVGGNEVKKPIRHNTRELIKSALAEKKQEVVNSDRKADWFFAAKILKMGDAYIISANKVALQKIKFSAKAKVNKLEQIDSVISQLCQAIIDEKPIPPTPTSTAAGAAPPPIAPPVKFVEVAREKTLSRWYLGVGTFRFLSLNSESNAVGASVAFTWEAYTQTGLKLFWENAKKSVGDSQASFTNIGFGGHYYFSDTPTSAVAAADFGYATTELAGDDTYAEESTKGLSLGLGAGMQFFRNSKVAIDLSLRYVTVLRKNEKGNPRYYGLRLGLLY